MKVTLKEAIIGIAIAAFIGIMVIPALAADGQGSCKAANKNDCIRMVWDTVTAPSNTTGIEKKNGVTLNVLAVFVNAGSASVDAWLQHADKIENDSCTTATFANAISSAITIDPGDSDSFIHQASITLLPCVRWHVRDVDIISNDITFITWMW